ncbi:hypothetical protein ACFL6I_15805 [candidate division KSB1 bacterium]
MNINFKLISRFLSFLCVLFIVYSSFGQPGPPPQHGDPGDHPVGGSAPIGSGLIILLVLGAGYGSKKVYDRIMIDKSKD